MLSAPQSRALTAAMVCNGSMDAPKPDVMAAETAGIDLLESPGMREPLELAVASLEGTVESWQLAKLQHRPGAGSTGIFTVRLRVPDGGERTEYVCITTAAVPECGLPLVRHEADAVPLTAWLYPSDPVLIGLPAACDPAAVGRSVFGGGEAELRMVSYRPLRRAVRAGGGPGRPQGLPQGGPPGPGGPVASPAPFAHRRGPAGSRCHRRPGGRRGGADGGAGDPLGPGRPS